MRATWVDGPSGVRRRATRLDGLALGVVSEGGFIGEDDLVRIVGDCDVVITCRTALPARLFVRCPWVRGVVGVGPDAIGLVEWERLRSRGLRVALVPGPPDGDEAWMAVLDTLRDFDHAFSGLDAIAETWEGT